MKTLKTLFALFSFTLLLGCQGANSGSGKKTDGNSQDPDSTEISRTMSGFEGYDCSNPSGNSDYLALEGNEAIIRYKLNDDIIIVEILDTMYSEPPANPVNTSGILNELRDTKKVLEIAFCRNNMYFKVHSKPPLQTGNPVCDLNESGSNITCTKTEISVDIDPITAPDYVQTFSNGNDKSYFLFTEKNAMVRTLYYSFRLGS